MTFGLRGCVVIAIVATAGCSSIKQTTEPLVPPVEQEAPIASGSTPAPQEPVKDTDTVDSLTRDVDGLQRELIQYSGPLTPKQELEVETIKNKIDKKESKKASLELKKMLGDLKEEE